MLISEIFGFGVNNKSDEAWASREQKLCPFRGTKCTKDSKADPLGVCSLSDGVEAAATCPVRFTENDRIFHDAAKLAFGENVEFGVYSEIRILKIETDGKKDKKIGKVDYLLGRIENNRVTDFAALEVQGVYFSGGEIRTALYHYLKQKQLDPSISDRRADYRSSAQKRLVPQLQLKVPVFRRWGKKFFVVVDTQFFRALPKFKETTISNSEVTWLSYPIAKTVNGDYHMTDPNIVYSEWDEIQNSLREGSPPEPSEIIDELQGKLNGSVRTRPKILTT